MTYVYRCPEKIRIKLKSIKEVSKSMQHNILGKIFKINFYIQQTLRHLFN